MLGRNCLKSPGKAKETAAAYRTPRQHWMRRRKCQLLSEGSGGTPWLTAAGQRSWLSCGLEKDGEPLLLSRAPGLFDHPGPGASWLSNPISLAAGFLTAALRRCSLGQAGEVVMRRQGTSHQALGLAWHWGCLERAHGSLSLALGDALPQPTGWVIPMASITTPCWQLPAPHLHLHLDVS